MKHIRPAEVALLGALLCMYLILAFAAQSCAPGTKPIDRLTDAVGEANRHVNTSDTSRLIASNATCEPISNDDVLKSMYWLASPPSTLLVSKHSSGPGSVGAKSPPCTKLITIGDVAVCEDRLVPGQCLIISAFWADACDDVGSLAFERHYSSVCQVKLLYFYRKDKECSTLDQLASLNASLTVMRYRSVKGPQCVGCLYNVLNSILPASGQVDVLKLGRPDRDVAYSIDTSRSSGDSRQGKSNYIVPTVIFPMLAEMYINAPTLLDRFDQVALSTVYNVQSLIDNYGLDCNNAWNIWATRHMLRGFASVHTISESGPFKLRPLQFQDVFDKLGLNSSISTYHHTMVRLQDESAIAASGAIYRSWAPRATAPVVGHVPSYCRAPSIEERMRMQKWIDEELLARCHPFSMWVPCDFSKRYDGFVPCRQEMSNNLAEDYAATMQWCNFSAPEASVPELLTVDPRASGAFTKPPLVPPSADIEALEHPNVRLAFLFTVYADFPHVKRILRLLYSPTHYYLFHIDPAGASSKFNRLMEEEIAANYSKHNNVFISRDVPIVYGASTATMLLTKAMAWFLRRTSGWDYLVSVTGSDYPTMPLRRLEWILASQQPPMPFVMAWVPRASTHSFRIQKTHPVFNTNPYLLKSLDAITVDRGRPIGVHQMEFRSNNFGPPLFCNGQQSFYHLNNRLNKSNARMDTQWLFPRGGSGRALSYDMKNPPPSADGVRRIWKKSDPATTGIFDLESVRYIVESEEGRRYWHFFKRMLLASEEHYYISLLFNWNRTSNFVQSLSSEMAWNTWTLGLDVVGHGFQTHTHFLAPEQLDIIKGFAMRGVMFPRKFNTKKSQELLDMIDSYIHLNASTDAGLYWPGFFNVDVLTPGPKWKAKLRNSTAMAEMQTISKFRDKVLI